LKPYIDLRSDTVTRPTAAMRAAMAAAIVGDDVFDDDPTVHRLQDMAAWMLGKEAALFMPSGTMSNAVAIKTHTSPGDEVLMDANAHSMLYEAGNPATIAHVLTRQYHSESGIPCADEIVSLIHRESLHSPRTALILIENTHNRAGGAVVTADVHAAIYGEARARGVSVHVDGARLFNAAAALGVSAATIAASADSITFCLSKGLGCPVGSVLCGTRGFIERARRVRKMLGGGLRQAGILAAAGIYALENHIDRLGEDHANARRLAGSIEGVPGMEVTTKVPASNMVYLDTSAPAETMVERMRQEFGVLVSTMGSHVIRAVTHLDVDSAEVDRAGDAFLRVGAELTAP
jgi:threonine aldolase